MTYRTKFTIATHGAAALLVGLVPAFVYAFAPRAEAADRDKSETTGVQEKEASSQVASAKALTSRFSFGAEGTGLSKGVLGSLCGLATYDVKSFSNRDLGNNHLVPPAFTYSQEVSS